MDSYKKIIAMLEEQNKAIVNQISNLIESELILKQKREVIKTIPGIGDIVSFELLILLPELGTLDPRKIASLAGLTPRANDSGKYQGYRRFGNGRAGIKSYIILSCYGC